MFWKEFTHASKRAQGVLKYLPVLGVLLVTVIGLFIGNHLDRLSSDSQSKAATPYATERNNPEPPIVLETMDPCSSTIYTSLPPKCKTVDGEYIPIPGSYIFVTPEGK